MSDRRRYVLYGVNKTVGWFLEKCYKDDGFVCVLLAFVRGL